MRIAVTSTGPTLDDAVETRFGRCAYFLIIDPDTLEFESLENPNIALGGGAGIQSAQLMAERGVSHVLTGNCGPNAFQVFNSVGVQVITGVSGTVREAVDAYRSGSLSSASAPNVQSHFGMGGGGGRGGGMGRGMGMGQGGGGGRGGGTGRGMGMGQGGGGGRGGGRGMGTGQGGGAVPAGDAAGPASTPAGGGTQELADLREQAAALQEQMERIMQRIDEIEKNGE